MNILGTNDAPQVLLNESATVNPALTKELIDLWVPRCYRQGPGPACVHSYLFMHTLTGPEDDEDLESAAVSPTFRRAKMHLLPTWYMSLGHEMNYEDRVSFAHDVVGPTLYKYVWCEIFFPRGKYFSCNISYRHSEHSYYSESEYSLDGDSWK